VPAELRGVSCLPDNWLQRIGQFGLAIEQLFGTPQDVEWAVSGGQLWILQSRAVTALADSLREAPRFPLDWHDDEEARHFWWVERAEPLLPAQLDFMCINTRGGHDAVYNRGGSDTRWRKAVNGRVYMAKAKSPNSPGHVRVYTAAARDLYERLAQQGITWWEYWGPEIVRATDRLAAFKPEQADGLCLAEHLEDALAAAVRHWMIHTIVPGRPIRSARLLELYARILGRPAGDLAAEIPFLLAGSETIQTKLVESLFELANLALADPHSAKMIVLGSAGDVQAEIPALTLFAAGFDQLMRAYGGRLCFRQVAGSPAELPSAWREAPEYVWSLIAAYIPLARQGGPGPRETRLKQLSAMDARIEALCSDALKRGLDQTVIEDFRQSLAYARRNAVYLDEHNHYIDQLSEGQFVQSLIYAGRWLAERACLPNPTDVFWLTSDEVLAALRDCPPGLDAFLTQRRAQFSEWQPLLPPACLGLPDAKLPDRPGLALRQAQAAADPLDLPANSLMGEPASRGRVSGRARLMAGAYPPLDILPGDVLVAAFAGPTMIPILPAVAALALDYGGPGDHFAITAREFGLTSVCALRYATQKIPEGAWVTVDGDTGLVTWNSPGSLG
jgi:pyruvate,water dikinase